MSKEQAKEKIKKLIVRCESLSETEKKHYNEQQTKKDVDNFNWNVSVPKIIDNAIIGIKVSG